MSKVLNLVVVTASGFGAKRTCTSQIGGFLPEEREKGIGIYVYSRFNWLYLILFLMLYTEVVWLEDSNISKSQACLIKLLA